MKMSEFAVKRPITTIMTVISIMVLGVISLFRLPLEYMPSITFPSMYISVNYPSSSPEEVARLIARPIEEMMGTLSDVKGISSTASGSSARIRLEFDMKADMDLVAVHVRDRLDQVRNLLPDDVDRIEIRRWNSEDFPILEYSLTWGGDNENDLVDVYNQMILPRVQRLEGVGNVTLQGLEEKVLLVNVDQNKLSSHNLDFRTINRALRNNNANISAGFVADGDRRLPVRAIGEYQEMDQIGAQPLRANIQLNDIADVSYDYPERKSFERLDGRESISLEIQKSSTANMVNTANLVRAELDAILDEVGHDKLKALIVRDRSNDVTVGISNLAQSAIMGGILAVVAIFIFLRNFRSTLIIGSAIPVSALFVFLIMYFMRQFTGATITLNLISMMGLMVAIGMLVDPAVVALENIFRKRYDEGLDPVTAALEGSDEIGVPVLAASLTTICVFIPIIFVTDSRSALFMRDFALTVVISVVASFFVALSLIPLATSRAFRDGMTRLDTVLKTIVGLAAVGGTYALFAYTDYTLSSILGSITQFFTALLAVSTPIKVTVGILFIIVGLLVVRYRKIGIKGAYERLITTTLHYRWATLSAAVIILFGGNYMYGKIEQQPYRFQRSGQVGISVELPRNYDVHDARALFQQVEKLLLPKSEELDFEALGTRYSTRRSNSLTLYLKPPEESKLSSDEVKEKVMALLPKDIPGVRFKTGRSRGGGVGVGIEIKGRNPQVLEILAEDIRTQMEGLPGVNEVVTSLESGTEEIRVTVNRERAQRYGLSPQEVASNIASALGTRGGTQFKTPDGEIDITVQLREEDRATLEQLKNTEFESDAGMVTFASLANFDVQKGRNSIQREDRMSTVSVFANTESSARFRVGMMMQERMQAVSLPKGYSAEMDRSFRWMTEEQNQDSTTMLFAAVLIYIIMASLFESYVHPFTIMFCIGFAFIGVALGLYTTGIAMDSNAKYGLLILFGIVVNNGIVLVDHINRYRKQGLFRRDAIIRGGQDRLRPIMMTATTTIIGLMPLVLPMLYGNSDGTARRWGPIGLVVISGLSVSTLMTLVLLPTVYSLMDDLSHYAKRVVAATRA
ncbi:MAG: HAE1 family hydrophobic/amphiphilic exporter-1 [Candidatus Latescibacterota bacterium]|jgi:HAE1 family hydrophobic/amphiphilic exporter-1